MKRLILKLTFAVILFFMGIESVDAQSLVKHYGKVKNGYNFWLYTPANVEKPKPVVIFLHGASLRGTDLNQVRRYGTIDAIERGRKIDAYVIAPQVPKGWWKPEKIINVLEWVKKHHNVDESRVYVLGMSLGGFGSIDLAAQYPDKIAAAMAFCGGGNQKSYKGLTKVPLWIIHGTADKDVEVKYSDAVVKGMKKFKDGTKRLHYDRIEGMDHSSLARMFYTKKTYDWLFKHSLTDEGRNMQPVFEVSKKTLTRAVYSDLKRKSSKQKTTAKSGSKTKSKAKAKATTNKSKAKSKSKTTAKQTSKSKSSSKSTSTTKTKTTTKTSTKTKSATKPQPKSR
jgi:poly(3-hydroxybutyrate) depolymerase